MTKVFLALGANVGDSLGNIEKSIKFLSKKLKDIKRAEIYSSKAVGYTDQPDFTNTAISGQTDLSPKELLKFVKEIEDKIGRVKRFRWGPREVDIDIIFYDDLVMESDELTIPHLHAHKRDFVLRPVCNLDCNFIHPKLKLAIRELLAKLPESELSIIEKT